MIKFKLNSRLGRSASAAVLLGMLMGVQPAMGCTVDNWNGGNSGAGVLASGPDGPDGKPAIARYSGVCAMQTADSSAEWVQDESPGGIDRIRARFYVLNELASGQSAVVYRGFSTDAGTGSLFTVRLATDGTVRLIDNATGIDVEQSAATPWVSVEIDWTQGSGDGVISLSVNGQAPVLQNALNNAGSSLQSVRLGNLLGAAGTLNFDAYESRRSTAVGTLCACDANASGDDVVNIQDYVVTTNEAGGTSLASGQPDCNGNGSVDIQDMVAIINIAGSTGSCGSL